MSQDGMGWDGIWAKTVIPIALSEYQSPFVTAACL